MYKILIIEDDITIANTVSNHLDKWGYETRYAEDFQNIMALFTNFEPDLVLMDITLPYYNGFHWCSEIRKISNTPIVFISSISDNMNIVMAMNMGGDEYIEKPFDINVLTAKIQALLRRTYTLPQQRNVLSYRNLELNMNSTELCCIDETLSLSKNEYMILQLLMERHGTVVSREELMEKLWGNDEFIDDNTLTVNVTRVRKKLESLGCIDYLKTKKGIGYILE
ncbi:MAG: response regulator transcription factor [Lachnospiraceae bacterium]|nr:response regulator transcription factor [Lachnospiraceae bacterium]